MSTNCIFTICSKNYLAQALTLKESAQKHETDTDFFIFLADLGTEDIKEIEYEPLDESWIPSWKEMAFKYNVIFSCHDHQLTQTVANRIIELTEDGYIDRMMHYDEYMHLYSEET